AGRIGAYPLTRTARHAVGDARPHLQAAAATTPPMQTASIAHIHRKRVSVPVPIPWVTATGLIAEASPCTARLARRPNDGRNRLVIVLASSRSTAITRSRGQKRRAADGRGTTAGFQPS